MPEQYLCFGEVVGTGVVWKNDEDLKRSVHMKRSWKVIFQCTKEILAQGVLGTPAFTVEFAMVAPLHMLFISALPPHCSSIPMGGTAPPNQFFLYSMQ